MRSDIALGSVTLVMAILGGIVSAYALKKPWQKWTCGIAFVVFGGIGMYFVVRQSNEAVAATDTLNGNVKGLQIKLDSLGTWIKAELAKLHSQGPPSEPVPKHYERSATENLALSDGATMATNPVQSESQRRQAILQALRMEYILSHDDLSAGLLAGKEWPPLDWVNQKLKELKENWAVVAGSAKGELQFEEESH
jgi:hypothetical protein